MENHKISSFLSYSVSPIMSIITNSNFHHVSNNNNNNVANNSSIAADLFTAAGKDVKASSSESLRLLSAESAVAEASNPIELKSFMNRSSSQESMGFDIRAYQPATTSNNSGFRSSGPKITLLEMAKTSLYAERAKLTRESGKTEEVLQYNKNINLIL